MFDFYQLTDALTASLFGMFALWAAASRRHWFVRMAVVGAALLVMLLIPAYEPMVEFTVQILLVICGLKIWRRWRRPEVAAARELDEGTSASLRISLETLLLFTAVVAVVTTVAARAPRLTPFTWYELIYVGAAGGLMVLVSTWLVCGKLRWWLRLILWPVLVCWAALTMRWLWISRWMLEYWYRYPQSVSQYWKSILKESVFSGTSHWVGSIGMGTFILCTWLFLVRQAHWFDPFRESQDDLQKSSRDERRQFVARCVAIGLFLLVGSYSVWLLYLLLTPKPVPDLAGAQPNGYNALLKAGRMIGLIDQNGRWPTKQKSTAEIIANASKNAAAFDVVHAAIQGECSFPLPRGWVWDDVHHALTSLQIALWERETLASTIGWKAADRESAIDLLKLAFAEDRSNGVDPNGEAIFVPVESMVVNNLWFRKTKLDSQQCVDLTQQLSALESRRVEWDTKVAHQRIIAENTGWEPHLRAILDRWSGVDRFANERRNYLISQTRMRILIVALALHAYELDNNRLPSSLDELMPKYLPAIPHDPFDPSQPLHYRWPGATYMLYSVGPNKVDDSEDGNLDMSTGAHDDITEAGQFPASSDPDLSNTGSTTGQSDEQSE